MQTSLWSPWWGGLDPPHSEKDKYSLMMGLELFISVKETEKLKKIVLKALLNKRRNSPIKIIKLKTKMCTCVIYSFNLPNPYLKEDRYILELNL